MTISHAGYDNVTASLPSRQECLPLWAPLLYLNAAFPRSNVGLGCLSDISQAHLPPHYTGTVEPDQVKAARALKLLKGCQEEGIITLDSADTVYGKGVWMSLQLSGRIGSAALQPFKQRASGVDGHDRWTVDMDHSLELLSVILSPEFIPRITINLKNAKNAADVVREVHVDLRLVDEPATDPAGGAAAALAGQRRAGGGRHCRGRGGLERPCDHVGCRPPTGLLCCGARPGVGREGLSYRLFRRGGYQRGGDLESLDREGWRTSFS